MKSTRFWGDETMASAVHVIYDMREDTVVRETARMREKSINDWNNGMITARREGIAEGEAKGIAKGRAEGRAEKETEIITKLLNFGLSQSEINAALGR